MLTSLLLAQSNKIGNAARVELEKIRIDKSNINAVDLVPLALQARLLPCPPPPLEVLNLRATWLQMK